MTEYRQLCFVLMPFGKKQDIAGSVIDFDSVYDNFIGPCIKQSGLEPIRADEEMTGGVIHKPMFERLIFCDFAVADLTTANANVFYELGIRHAVRPWSTVLLYATGRGQLPFDVGLLRATPYSLNPAGTLSNVENARDALLNRLLEAQKEATDSPIYQLVDGFPKPDISHIKTDVFRDRVQYSSTLKEQLTEARSIGKKDNTAGVGEVRKVEMSIQNINDVESGVIVDLMLAYRDVKAWQEVVGLIEKMPVPLASTVMVQEQLALALNRLGHGEKAEQTLKRLLNERGASSETYGILGRIYKDRWQESIKNNDLISAEGLLDEAIDAYMKGFETDWRDAYPGINALSLLEIKDPTDPRIRKLFPIVSYAVERRFVATDPDYWDYATQLELAIISKDEKKARQMLSKSIIKSRVSWEPETTANNLSLIGQARERRQESIKWANEMEQILRQRASQVRK